ncbi:5'-methylthioadenosine/S-adenosylhomocysteine nucleosidase [Alteromonas gilva]|uniref:5'-methylthioadenosine/S-adenosylhomocysteine nucleosidase n=1 Tax=Alteromonas gilva TaxID=2987522 RepID=A0ABT5L0I0_9ALTE|nr:5'-methylthioadenosine/S-adenosylhomocysteine nucleosidase [Alteromonas gilva]MDC8830536.1 5'-methylthioadenosine/S-adenosylhomocysteine nucleosidase [Alteromonas gilva]
MHKKIPLVLLTLLLSCLSSLLYAAGFNQVQISTTSAAQAPVMIQGPMPIEAEYFASLLSGVRTEQAGNVTFYIGKLKGFPVVVAQTGKGLENTSAATAVGIERYRPQAIINQGTSGGHDPALEVGDIVLGKRSVNASNFKTPFRKAGTGSAPLEWLPMDLLASEGSAGEGDSAKDAERIRYYMGNEALLHAAHAVKEQYTRGKVVEGTIASGNFWNNELDRIAWLHAQFGTSTEEMETAAAAQIAHSYSVPFLGIRVLSNNLTNGGHYDPSTAKDCQQFVRLVIEQYISSLTPATNNK